MTSHRRMWTGTALGASALALGLFLFPMNDEVSHLSDANQPPANLNAASSSKAPSRSVRPGDEVLGATLRTERTASDDAWEDRLATKPSQVLAFFEQETATKEQWALAYEADTCACEEAECVSALQNDFLNRAPTLVDRTMTKVARAAMRHAAECGAAVLRGER